MAAFFTGYCLCAAFWCAADWERTRNKSDAVFFWLNLIVAVGNALLWWVA